MGFYQKATICLNGHTISCYGESNDMFCSHCGAATISKCPCCNAPIRGEYVVEGVFDLTSCYDAPKYCYSCGKPFPWTEFAIKSLSEIIHEDEKLTELDCSRLTDSLPDIVSETPRTSLAVTRVQKVLKNAGKFTAEAIRQFAIDFGCEFVKKQLNL